MDSNKKVFTFTWKIENFSMLPFQKIQGLDSKTFVVNMHNRKTEWFLKLFPRGISEQHEDYVAVLFYEKTEQDIEFKVNYILALESTDSTSEVRKGRTKQLTGGRGGTTKFIRRIDLYEKKNFFLPNDVLTLRLELYEADENSSDENVNDISVSPPYVTEKSCFSRTSIPVHRHSVIWPININKRRELPKLSIPLTSTTKDSSFSVSCDLSNISNIDYVPIEIRNTESADDGFELMRPFVNCKITVIGAHKEYQDCAEGTYLFKLDSLEFDEDDVFHFPPFIKTSNLTSDKYLHFDDTLFLQCELAVSYARHIYHSEFNHIPLAFETKELHIKSKFFENLEDHYMKGKYSDIRLQAGGEIFPAYKMLLCARSSVFTAMFEHDMKEKDSSVIEIANIEPTTLKRMLEFIHVDTVNEELSLEDACKLYMAADMYNIHSLKQMCSMLLASSLCVANVCDILALADASNDNFLMNVASRFISIYSTEIFHSTHWEGFMEDHSKLAMKIMHQWIKGRQI